MLLFGVQRQSKLEPGVCRGALCQSSDRGLFSARVQVGAGRWKDVAAGARVIGKTRMFVFESRDGFPSV